MRYYLVSEEVAQSLNLTDCRRKSEEGQYILSQADIITFKDKAELKEISEAEALYIVQQLKQ